MAAHDTHEFDVIVIGARGAGLRGHRGQGAGAAHCACLQITAGQGPYRHGRRRGGSGPRQCMARGQPAGPFS
jgi:hypothetical protein